ncbi:general substrate transporter [Calycina marina]|uniref:General substrate transporter n=1 Tax=Calycina marina TaxID=1763456 RepID=A0A9P7Z7L7_9HELO|nr:general substrate transporter [Calycina marina]
MAESVEAPLMPREADDEYLDSHNVSQQLEKNLQKPSIFLWLLTFSAGVSGLLFGYDTGVISATLVSIKNSLGHPLSAYDKSIITSITALFALLVSPVSGMIADKLGRKRVILLADIAFVAGALIQAISGSVWLMVLGRATIGLAVGAGSFVVPLYIAELAPAPFRGRLVTLNILFVTIGQVVAYVIGWIFVQFGDEHTGWRWIVGLGAVPAIVQALVMTFMPETPRWLVMSGRRDEARVILNKVYGTGSYLRPMVDGVLKGIEKEVQEEEEAKRGRIRGQKKNGAPTWLSDAQDTWEELLGIGGNRRALNIACLLQGLQQLCGFNSLMYFSATIFQTLEFQNPTLASLSVALTNFVMTCVALLLIDRVGRRRILLYSIPVMAAGLVCCSIGFHFIRSLPDVSSPADKTVSKERLAPSFVLASIMLYVAAYALGLGNVPWMQSELFPLNVRSLGSGISTSTNWGANFVVGLTFLPMMELFTPSWTFVIYAVLCMGGWVCIRKIYPETKGLSLEGIGNLLADGWGVPRSERLDMNSPNRSYSSG